MHPSSDLSFPLEQFQHLPNPYYPHDALRDSLVRTNIVNLDLASPPPPARTNPRSHPLTPPDTPGHRRSTTTTITNAYHHGLGLDQDGHGYQNYDERDAVDSDGELILSGESNTLKRTALDAFLSVGLRVNGNSEHTRYLVLAGVPPSAPTTMLSQVFSRMGALKGLFVRYQNKGVVVLSWHDLRDAKKAHYTITSNRLFNMDEALSAGFITPFNLIKSTGESLFVNPKEGNLTITAELPTSPSSSAVATENIQENQQLQQQQRQHPISLHAALALFGELSSFSAQESVGSTTYFASYYDAREAASAAKSLHGRSILGMRIHVVDGFSQDISEDSHGPRDDNNNNGEGSSPQQQQQQQLSPVSNSGKSGKSGKSRSKAHLLPSPTTPDQRKLNLSSSSSRHRAQSGTPDSEDSDTSGTPHVHVQSPAPAPALTPSPDAPNTASSSISSASNVKTNTTSTANSPIAQLPPSSNLVVRQHRNGLGKVGFKQHHSATTKVEGSNNNVPLYSTPSTPASAASGQRMRTLSTPGLMRSESISPPHHLMNRAIPPRLSLPWLQAQTHGQGQVPLPLPYNGVGMHHLPAHPQQHQVQTQGPQTQGQGPLTLGPGVYIHGLDNNLTPQPVHSGPYAYNPPPPPPTQFSAANPASGPGSGPVRAYIGPMATNSNTGNGASTSSSSAGTGTTNTSTSNNSPTNSHHPHQKHPSSSPHMHTLSTSTTSTTSTSTGPSTLDSSGPSTPLHVYGHTPALSAKRSFDMGHLHHHHQQQQQQHHHYHRYPYQHGHGSHALVNLPHLSGAAGGVADPRKGSGAGTGGDDGASPVSTGAGAGAGAEERNGLAQSALPNRPREGLYAGGGAGMYHGHTAPERNGVDIGKIEAGLDTRTTVMLKNVPNKMSDADLRKYISEVVPNSFDFVYLRFDFNSSANVGYAFVNFVEVADLLSFAKARLGVKWNMFCSEKVLQMSYANFQGKEALVEKFKNSCVMEMQDEWVPKIFYSSGPQKGQREPFPPSTNPSRARRSQDQRERGLLRGSGLFIGGRGHLTFKYGQ